MKYVVIARGAKKCILANPEQICYLSQMKNVFVVMLLFFFNIIPNDSFG